MSKESYIHKDIEKLSESLFKRLSELNEVLGKLHDAGVWVDIEKDSSGVLFKVNIIKQFITYYERQAK
jgi:hypothetical protein